MKQKSTALPFTLLGIVATLLAPGAALGADSNFQIAPPPIAYPYFEPGRTDSKIEPVSINIEAKDFSLSGGGVNFDTRHVFTEMLAMDFQGGFFALNGEMPGVPPITPIPAYSSTTGNFMGYYIPRTTGKAKVKMTSIQVGFNLEFQPVHGEGGGLIIFGGPNLGMAKMTMETPYNLYWAATGTTTTGFTDTLTVTSTTVGFQLGLQGDIAIAENFRLSPFIMTSANTGSATMTDDPGVKGVSGDTTTADIPSSSSMAMGMDIIIGDLSLGTVIQQMKPKENETEGVKITMFRLGYRF